ncbi:phage tail protein [Actinobacillus genomosp. 2]|uniref:phage tail-collar fiber domain-containing protein n=1 Tax=Actinobacillus genomosp. 2 TaxID=230709 RepID=UPI00244286E3|nr:phage tail protein [Actinobacillus genomosp. 2]WGE32560.1 phage tail protein [Actinobacillus genomosp. 2]
MTMLASSDFEKYVAQQTAKNQPVVFDQMIFCNISGLAADNLQNYLTMPIEIAHRVDISRAGYIDENKVVYSAVLGSNVGVWGSDLFYIDKDKKIWREKMRRG